MKEILKQLLEFLYVKNPVLAITITIIILLIIVYLIIKKYLSKGSKNITARIGNIKADKSKISIKQEINN